MTLSDALALCDPRAAWFGIQKALPEADKAALQGAVQLRVFDDEIVDFEDTAALVAEMDLIISVDTSLAHLAGNMGRACWVMLPFNPDWRWLMGREDTPWYPNLRLFRQESPGDWAGVIAAVRAALAERFP